MGMDSDLDLGSAALGGAFRVRPMTQAFPLTFKDVITLQELVYNLRTWCYQLGPDIKIELDRIITETNSALDGFDGEVTEAKNYWENLFNQFMEDVEASLAALNDTSVAGLIALKTSETRKALDLVFNPQWVANTVKDSTGPVQVELKKIFNDAWIESILKDSASKSNLFLTNTFMKKLSLVFNVKDYGAKGDGVSDDLEPVRLAFEASKARGGIVFFPASSGDYIINGSITIYSDTIVTGAKSTIRKTNGSYNLFVGLAKTKMGYGSGASRIEITGLTFKGDLSLGYSMNVVSLHRGSGIKVSNCEFIECVIGGHVIDLQGCEDVDVDSNRFLGCKPSAGRAYSEAVQIDSSSFNGVGFPIELAEQEAYDGIASRNVRVTRNTFAPYTRGGVTYAAPSPFGSHSYVDGRPYTGIEFSDNTIRGVVSLEGGAYTGILHFVGVQGITISGNTVDGSTVPNNTFVRFMGGGLATLLADVGDRESTLKPAASPVQAKHVRIHGNHIKGFENAGHLIWAYGIESSRCRDVKVYDNEFVNTQKNASSGTCVRFTFTDALRIYNNEHDDTGAPVYVGYSYDVTIKDNNGTTNADYAIDSIGCRDFVAFNNEFDGMGLGYRVSSVIGVRFNNNRGRATKPSHGIQIIGAPDFTSYLMVKDNVMTNSSGANTGSTGVYSNATSYPKGLVSGNLLEKYGTAVNVNAGVTANDNILI